MSGEIRSEDIDDDHDNDDDDRQSIHLRSGGSSSSRSRHAVIEGSKSFAWNNEKVRSDQPYVDGRYYMPHNPPPNEMGFVGGLGKQIGRNRSKVHSQRPTQLQQICGMRNQNMILHSFTQPIPEVFCPKQRSNQPGKDMPAIVRDITSADMVASTVSHDTGSLSSVPSSSSGQRPFAKSQATIRQSQEIQPQADELIDGKPFYYSPKTIKQRVHDYLAQTSKDDIYADAAVIESDGKAFRRWALKMRDDANTFPNGSDNESETEKSGGGKAARSQTAADSYRTDGVFSSVGGQQQPKKKGSKAQNIIRKITGYMYGPFTRLATPDLMTRDANKFGIPTSMTARVQSFERRRKVQDDVLRRMRMEEMGMHQPPDGDASSEENESKLNLKKLALVRTPYFALPTIRVNRTMQKYDSNTFLRGDRLKRINLLLRDEKQPKDHSTKALEERSNARQKKVIEKFAQLKARRKVRKDISGRNPEKAKYHEIIDEDYEKNRTLFEQDEEVPKPITFGQFKNIPDPVDLQLMAITLDPLEQRSNAAETDCGYSLRTRFAKSQPRKLFERSRNERLSNLDNIEGPFYIDPNLMDKFRSPKKFKSPQKYYTNLIKGKHWIRDRLQVNGPAFEEEKVGVSGEKYHHRLATEWDEYYMHDLRHRPRVRKFCVKTDVLTIREITRRNYIMYNVQENLMDMKEVQQQASEYMDEIEKFQQLCVKQFVVWKSEAYEKVVVAHERLNELRREIDQLKTEHREEMITLDRMNLRLFQMEERWNYLVVLQNYYYLLQSTVWREQYDWIHRSTDGQLEMPLTAYKLCTQRNIRPGKESSGIQIMQFFQTNIEPNLTLMRKVTPDKQQFKECLELLNANCMKGLIQHNKTFWMFKGVLSMAKKHFEHISNATELKRTQIEITKRNSELLLQHADRIKNDALDLVEKSMPSKMRNPVERKVLAIASELHKHLRHTDALDERKNALTPLDRFLQVQQYAMDVLAQLDEIPLDVLRIAEKFMRANRQMIQERLADALTKQKRYDLMHRQILNHFNELAQFRRVQVKIPIIKKCE